MFGKKKENGSEAALEDAGRAPDAGEPMARTAPRPGPNIPGRTQSGPLGPAFDPANRPGAGAPQPQRSVAAGAQQQSPAEDKKLIVGNHIRLKGEVTSCDTMIVEGQVELSRSEARHIQISPTGVFLGDVEVDEADISGRFEGGLTARERLVVRATGEVQGRIRYGKIVVESGGTIAGEIGAIGSDADKARTVTSLGGRFGDKAEATPALPEAAKEKAAGS